MKTQFSKKWIPKADSDQRESGSKNLGVLRHSDALFRNDSQRPEFSLRDDQGHEIPRLRSSAVLGRAGGLNAADYLKSVIEGE